MEKTLMQKWAKEVIKKTGFKSAKLIYSSDHGSKDNLRNQIYSGFYQGKPAVLKIYDEPRRIAEALSLVNFNKINRSRKLIGPAVYNFKIKTPFQGWYIMEKLPPDGHFLSEPNQGKPMDAARRKEFSEVFLEYRKNYPSTTYRPRLLAEKLPADEFHITRIHRWFEMANEREIEREMRKEKPVLDSKKFIPLYLKAQQIIRREFRPRKMFWSHGHFKPEDIFYSPKKSVYFITDFAHNYFYPEGYELSFIVWADWLMGADWNLNYAKWQKGIVDWKNDILPLMRQLKMKNPEKLWRASLIERTLGAILADVTASRRTDAEKKARLKLLLRLLADLVK